MDILCLSITILSHSRFYLAHLFLDNIICLIYTRDFNRTINIMELETEQTSKSLHTHNVILIENENIGSL